jgi:hypothetical protein
LWESEEKDAATMTSEPIFAVLALLALLAGFWIWLGRPAAHTVKSNELKPYIAALLRRGYSGGFMIIGERGFGRPGRRRFLQYSKYISAPGVYGLEMAFPLARWSREDFDTARDVVSRKGLRHRVERTGRSDTEEFLNVDIGRDVDAADDLAQSLIHEVFGMAVGTRLTVRFFDVSPHDELVDRQAGS